VLAAVDGSDNDLAVITRFAFASRPWAAYIRVVSSDEKLRHLLAWCLLGHWIYGLLDEERRIS